MKARRLRASVVLLLSAFGTSTAVAAGCEVRESDPSGAPGGGAGTTTAGSGGEPAREACSLFACCNEGVLTITHGVVCATTTLQCENGCRADTEGKCRILGHDIFNANREDALVLCEGQGGTGSAGQGGESSSAEGGASGTENASGAGGDDDPGAGGESSGGGSN